MRQLERILRTDLWTDDVKVLTHPPRRLQVILDEIFDPAASEGLVAELRCLGASNSDLDAIMALLSRQEVRRMLELFISSMVCDGSAVSAVAPITVERLPHPGPQLFDTAPAFLALMAGILRRDYSPLQTYLRRATESDLLEARQTLWLLAQPGRLAGEMTAGISHELGCPPVMVRPWVMAYLRLTSIVFTSSVLRLTAFAMCLVLAMTRDKSEGHAA